MIEKRWTINDSDGNVLNEFEGTMDSAWVGREFNGTTVASVGQLADATIDTAAPVRLSTHESLAGIRSACEDTDNDTLEKLKAAIVAALT